MPNELNKLKAHSSFQKISTVRTYKCALRCVFLSLADISLTAYTSIFSVFQHPPTKAAYTYQCTLISVYSAFFRIFFCLVEKHKEGNMEQKIW